MYVLDIYPRVCLLCEPLVIDEETVSEMSETNSTLTQLVAREDFSSDLIHLSGNVHEV
jgi:hypothetical protein